MVMFANNLPVPLGTSYGTVMADHVGTLKGVAPSRDDRIWLAVCEFRAKLGDFVGAEAAFARASSYAQKSALGVSVTQYMLEEKWFRAAQSAMKNSIVTGKCKLSKSGKTVIFSDSVLGRNDLSARFEFARAQMAAAGIDV